MQISTALSNPPSRGHNLSFQFKMEPKIHYAEDDCPVTPPDGFPKDDELQFEVEMLDFFEAKVSLVMIGA